MKRIVRILAIAAVLGAGAATAPASAATGTWTKITSPKGPGQPIYRLDPPSSPPGVTISGSTSVDLISGTDTINIYCFWDQDQTVDGPLNAAPLAITASHTFSGSIPTFTDQPCVLRAVPSTYSGISGSTNTGYAGAFAGPTWYTGLWETDGIPVHGMITEAFEQRGIVAVSSPDVEGLILDLPTDDFGKFAAVNPSTEANLALLAQNLTASGTPTASEIIVDGHNAYLPLTTVGIAAGGSTVPVDAFTKKRLSNGTLVVTESMPLSWCTGNAFPQSSGGCTVLPTGVTLKRSYVSSAQGAVVTMKDSFVSTDGGKHTLKAEYFNTLVPADNGEPGIMLPGHSSFSVPTPNTTVSNLPVGAHTIFTTSDIHATDGAPDRTDNGLTYSGKPIVYFKDADVFGLRYNRTVPAHGSTGMAFAEESGFSMTTVRSLANAAQKALTPHLTITSPKNNSSTSDNTPTIKGKVTNAVNGLPSKVTVTIGTRSKTVSVAANGTFAVTWVNLANGKHTAVARTTDPSGIRLSARSTFKVT